MNNLKSTWTKEEMKIYLLIFCANADFVELKVETDFIKARANKAVYKKMHIEYDKDNDYQSIQKIRSAFEDFNYSLNETEIIFNEIKELFLSDDDFSILERNVLQGLRHILES
jgi:hypothetical protein